MPATRATPYVVLGLLRFGPLSGYEIRAELTRATAGFWSESYGQIYPALRALRRADRVRRLGPGARKGPRTKGPRRKSTYAITAKGRAALEGWLALPPRSEPPRNELLVKLYLADREFLDKPEGWIRELLTRETERLERLRRMQAEVPRSQHRHPNVRFWSFTLSHGEAQAHATVAWCQKTLGTLALLQQARDRRLAAARRKLPFE